ncbi:CHC2 zinc finger domain-containing protein, partial [Saccharicrinis fermentans]
MKQSFTISKLLGFKKIESLVFEAFLSKTEKTVLFLQPLYRSKKYRYREFSIKKGIQPTVIKGCQYSFKSPFRDESKPSFSVNANKNLWYDFGVGEGGDIISLVRKMHNVDFREALRILGGNQYVAFEPKLAIPQKKLKRFEIKKALDEIESIYLISYLL